MESLCAILLLLSLLIGNACAVMSAGTQAVTRVHRLTGQYQQHLQQYLGER